MRNGYSWIGKPAKRPGRRIDAGQSEGGVVNGNEHAPNNSLHGRWLLAVRSGWVAVATLTVGLAAAGFAVALDQPELTRESSARSILAHAGLPDEVIDVALLTLVVAFILTGLLIFWRRSDDGAAMLFALTLVTSCSVPIRMEWPLEQAQPWLELPIGFLWLLSMFFWLIVLFIFPDGDFVPHWTRPLVVVAIPAAVLLVDLPRLVVELGDISQRGASARLALAVLVWLVFWAIGLYAQMHRYRHVSGPVQRQQTKWVALAMGLMLLVVLLGIFIPSLFLDITNPWFAWALLILLPVYLLFPASIAVAILRHHLYDIDRLISRTLTYGLLTVVLGVVYFGMVVLLGQALNPRAGSPSLTVAVSTLVIAALFRPLRRRVQDGVDRRFNRRRYDAARTIEAFSTRLREQLDLDSLSAELLDVVHQTMQPTKGSVWLRPPREGLVPSALMAERTIFDGETFSGPRWI